MPNDRPDIKSSSDEKRKDSVKKLIDRKSELDALRKNPQQVVTSTGDPYAQVRQQEAEGVEPPPNPSPYAVTPEQYDPFGDRNVNVKPDFARQESVDKGFRMADFGNALRYAGNAARIRMEVPGRPESSLNSQVNRDIFKQLDQAPEQAARDRKEVLAVNRLQDDRDPYSPRSRMARELARRMGVNVAPDDNYDDIMANIPGFANMYKAQLRQRSGGGKRPLSESTYKELSTYDGMFMTLDNIKGKLLGPEAKDLGRTQQAWDYIMKSGGKSTSNDELFSDINAVVADYIKAVSGTAASDTERAWLTENMPKSGRDRRSMLNFLSAFEKRSKNFYNQYVTNLSHSYDTGAFSGKIPDIIEGTGNKELKEKGLAGTSGQDILSNLDKIDQSTADREKMTATPGKVIKKDGIDYVVVSNDGNLLTLKAPDGSIKTVPRAK